MDTLQYYINWPMSAMCRLSHLPLCFYVIFSVPMSILSLSLSLIYKCIWPLCWILINSASMLSSIIMNHLCIRVIILLPRVSWTTRITRWSLHQWLQNGRESGGSNSHQPPFPETTCRQRSKRLPDNSTIFAGEATAISLALNYYQHMGPVLHDVVVHSDSMSCLQAIEGKDTHREPFHLPYHEPALVIEWQGHTCSFLLGTKPLWHWQKWKSGPTSKKDPRLRYRPTDKCPLYRYETTGQFLRSEVGSNQVGCSCTWQRSLSFETNTGAPEEIPAPNQSWRGCNHPTSNWPYQGHQIPYLVPRTANWLSPLWWNTDHWPYAAGVCIVTGMSWWILHSGFIECSLRDNSWDFYLIWCNLSTSTSPQTCIMIKLE